MSNTTRPTATELTNDGWQTWPPRDHDLDGDHDSDAGPSIWEWRKDEYFGVVDGEVASGPHGSLEEALEALNHPLARAWQHGTTVFSASVESGWGEQEVRIAEHEGRYYFFDEAFGPFAGPYPTLLDAARDNGALEVGAEWTVQCDEGELETGELTRLLRLADTPDPGDEVEVNGEAVPLDEIYRWRSLSTPGDILRDLVADLEETAATRPEPPVHNGRRVVPTFPIPGSVDPRLRSALMAYVKAAGEKAQAERALAAIEGRGPREALLALREAGYRDSRVDDLEESLEREAPDREAPDRHVQNPPTPTA
jgi:hypothetical protein